MKKKIKKELNIFSKTISFNDNTVLPLIYGEHDKFLKLIEKNMSVSILTRGNFLKVSGEINAVKVTTKLLENLFGNALKNNFIDEGEVLGMINLYKDSSRSQINKVQEINDSSFTAGRKLIKPRSKSR